MAGIDPRFYYLTFGLLAVCALVGLVVAFRFQREVEHDLSPPTEKDVIDPLEKAYYSGLMREDELQRIRESVGRRKAEAAPKGFKPKPKPKPVAPPEPNIEPDPEPSE